MWNLPCFFSPSLVSSGQPSAWAWRAMALPAAVRAAAVNRVSASFFIAGLRDYGLPPRFAPPLGFLVGVVAGVAAGAAPEPLVFLSCFSTRLIALVTSFIRSS